MGRHKKNILMPSGLSAKERNNWLKRNNFCVCCRINPIANYSNSFCDDCYRKNQKPSKRKLSERQKSFEEDINRADFLGLSYGQYMAKIKN